MKVQEALNVAIEALKQAKDNINHNEGKRESNRVWGLYDDAERLCKSALAEIEKCEPVYQVAIIGNWFDTNLSNYIKETGIKRILYTSPQPIDKCEPVGEVVMVQEPEWMKPREGFKWYQTEFPLGTKFYTSPISKEWVGLSDYEMNEIFEQVCGKYSRLNAIDIDFIRAIEQALKEKNHD